MPKLSIFQTALALVSTNIGGGLLAMPFAVYHLGIFLGLILLFIAAAMSHYSSVMYLQVKDLTPRRYESLYEIAYLLLGRSSIFVVCAIFFLSNYSGCILFYIMLGEALSNLGTQLVVEHSSELTVLELKEAISNLPWWQQLITSRNSAIVFVGVVQLAVIFKRQLVELKPISYIFLGIVVAFIGLISFELGTNLDAVVDTVNLDDISQIKFDSHLLTAVSIILFAYSVQFMVFPAFVELEKRTTERFTQASFIQSVILYISYIVVSVICVLLFGAETSNDLLVDVSKRPGAVSILIRMAYCILLFGHIPYFFFAVKEYILVAIDEVLYRSLTTNLEQKLSEYYFRKEEKSSQQFGRKHDQGGMAPPEAHDEEAANANDSDPLLGERVETQPSLAPTLDSYKSALTY